MNALILPLSSTEANNRLLDPGLLTDVAFEFPQWILKSRDRRVAGFEVDRVFTEILSRLVEVLALQPGEELVFLDTELRDDPEADGLPARSFRVLSGARGADVLRIIGGQDERFGLGNDAMVGVFDFLIVTPWCEVRGFMPDYGFVAFRDDPPAEVVGIFAPFAWELDDLLEALGSTWWVPTPDQPLPDFGKLKRSIPAELRAEVEANYGGLSRSLP